MRLALSAVTAAFLLFLVACGGETNPVTDLTQTSATLNGATSWDQGDGPGEYWYEISLANQDNFSEVPGSRSSFPDLGSSGGPLTYSKPVSGLQPGTQYKFRLCGYGDKDFPTTTVCVDDDGTIHNPTNPEGQNGVNYTRFLTVIPQNGFSPGIVANADFDKASRVADALNAPTARVEFDIGASTASMDAQVQKFTSKGVRPILLAGFSGFIPTVAQAQNLANWANRYGPGGTLGLPSNLAVQQIEFGNETSFCYQFDCSASYENSPSYIQRAKDYGSRAKTAAQAIQGTGKAVGLLVQADHGGSGSDNWVEGMCTQVPDLKNYVSGWTVHPYGPQSNWNDKLSKVVSQTNQWCGSNTLPIDITEYGFSSRDGQPVSNNYGWPTNQTYVQAGDALTSTVSAIRSAYPRVRDFMLYSTYDLQPVSQGTDREWYFGAVKSDETDKVGFTDDVRALLGNGGSLAARPFVRNVGGLSLRTEEGGPRLQLKGVNVWGTPDPVTVNSGSGTQHWLNQYNARATISQTVKNWGGNLIRLRVLADAYNQAPGQTAGLTKAQYIQRIKDWRDAAQAQGLYLLITPWDPLDGQFDDADWAGHGNNMYSLLSDIYSALGDDPDVIYELGNEPNGISLAQWDTNMRGLISHMRDTVGYKGLLVIDPINWANSGPSGAGFNETYFDGLEAYDDARSGMDDGPQLAFAKHDYADNYPNKTWNGTNWASAIGPNDQHLTFETEFGNWVSTTPDSTWSNQASAFFRDRFSQETYVGAAAFLWGPWTDANALTQSDNTTPTAWGSIVRDVFFSQGGCDVTLPSGSGFSVSANQTVCLSGTYNWGNYTVPSGATIKALPGVSASVTGEARLYNAGSTLQNLTLKAPAGGGHAVIDVHGDDTTVRDVDINTLGDPNTHGMIVGGGGAQPNNTKILDSKVHGSRPAPGSTCFAGTGSPLTGSQVHGIYWASGTNGLLQRDWIYDYSGYGLHFYGSGSVDGTTVDRVLSNSTASCSTSLGNVKDSVTGTITVDRSVVANGNWRCLNGGVTITNTWVTGTLQGSCTNVGGNTQGGTVFFQDANANDYRIQGNADFQFIPGPK